MRLVDVGFAVPRIFIVLGAIALWDRLTVVPLIVLLGVTGWFFGTAAGVIRAEVLVLRGVPFVEAARAMGAGPWRVMFRHVLPNAAAPLIVSAALGIGNVMLLEAALSFLGVGVQPPTPSWGNMIADGRDQLATAPWTTLFPGLAIALAVMALNAVGDGLRDALDRRWLTGQVVMAEAVKHQVVRTETVDSPRQHSAVTPQQFHAITEANTLATASCRTAAN